MHYPDSRWLPCCQGKSRDDHDVSGRNSRIIYKNMLYNIARSTVIIYY